MTVMPRGWVSETLRTYFGNATSVRDYRSQLRGSKALWLWGSYLAILIVVVTATYGTMVNSNYGGNTSVADIQMKLRSFYQMVMMLLSLMAMLIAPAMTASTIGVERQRRSLDLIFSAPVEPKYLLVGKLLSSFRYVWMLLILSLPITAVSVVMGGATWSDVLGAYVLISANGLIYASIGLLMSVLSPSPAAAVIYSFLSVGLYVTLTSFAMPGVLTSFFTGSLEAPWIVAISPFTVAMASQTYSIIGGVQVPNYLFAILFALAVTKYLLLAAGSALSPYASKVTISLRIHSVVYAFLLGAAMGYLVQAMAGFMGMVSGGGPSPSRVLTTLPAIFASMLFFLTPVIAAFGPDEGKKHENDGLFSWRGIWIGTPSGALPFVLMLLVCLFAGVIVGQLGSGVDWRQVSLGFIWTVGLLSMWWGVSRWLSKQSKTYRTAKLLTLAAILVIIAIPMPIITILAESISYRGGDVRQVWHFHLMYPITSDRAMLESLPYSIGMLFVATICGLASRRNATPRAVRSER